MGKEYISTKNILRTAAALGAAATMLGEPTPSYANTTQCEVKAEVTNSDFGKRQGIDGVLFTIPDGGVVRGNLPYRLRVNGRNNSTVNGVDGQTIQIGFTRNGSLVGNQDSIFIPCGKEGYDLYPVDLNSPAGRRSPSSDEYLIHDFLGRRWTTGEVVLSAVAVTAIVAAIIAARR